MIDKFDNVNIEYFKDGTNKLLRLRVPSRHVKKRIYNVYIKYNPEGSDIKSIEVYYCDCPNGRRTVGCCSHVSACIYYLSYARYLSKNYRPAEDIQHI